MRNDLSKCIYNNFKLHCQSEIFITEQKLGKHGSHEGNEKSECLRKVIIIDVFRFNYVLGKNFRFPSPFTVKFLLSALGDTIIDCAVPKVHTVLIFTF